MSLRLHNEFQDSLGFTARLPNKSNTPLKKGMQVKNEELEIYLFSCDRILYLEGPKDTTQNVLNLIHTFSKIGS